MRSAVWVCTSLLRFTLKTGFERKKLVKSNHVKKKQRKHLTIQEKLQIIELKENGSTFAKIEKDKKMNESTVRTIYKEKEKIKLQCNYSNWKWNMFCIFNFADHCSVQTKSLEDNTIVSMRFPQQHRRELIWKLYKKSPKSIQNGGILKQYKL